jgi:hypothetical protein
LEVDSVDKTLSNLHIAVAEELLKRIEAGDANAAELNVARAFLKDNGIDGVAEQGNPLENLAKSLPFNVELESA